jgi:hypothetical protein
MLSYLLRIIFDIFIKKKFLFTIIPKCWVLNSKVISPCTNGAGHLWPAILWWLILVIVSDLENKAKIKYILSIW